MAGGRGHRGARETPQERRERHAAVDDPDAVLSAAARFLEARSRSVAEVRRRLTSSGYREDLVERAIARLVELRMLDDEAFARSWVESRDRARPRGQQALARELALKGIDRETAAAVLAERRDGRESDEPDAASADEEAAARLLAKRGASLARIDDPRLRRQRAYALLARNGFDPETCRAVSAHVNDIEDGSPSEE